MSRRSLALVLTLGATSALAGCVLDIPVGARSSADDDERPPEQRSAAVDFLFVVDNSGSMCDNQEALVRAFFDADCPIQDLDQVPAALQDPSAELADSLLAECGFAQMMAAYDLDFRVGVLSTDVGECDNRFGLAESNFGAVCRSDPDWGRRPQRGCLQAPSSWSQKFLSRQDSAIGTKFATLMHNVGVYGSAFERGLDAVDVFLDDGAHKAPGCEGDARELLRDDAHLVLVFVSDEDDCSHQDGAFGFVDENAGESCANPTETFPSSSPAGCYDSSEQLAPVAGYVERWRQQKGERVSAVLLGGLVPDADGGLVAGGCTTLADGSVGGQCFASGGNSHQTAPGSLCDPAAREQPCCVADGAHRYLSAVRSLGEQGAAESICGDGFREALKAALAVAL